MQQPGSMMDRPLLVSAILEHGENQYGDQQIVSRDTDGSLHRYRFADMAQRARQLRQYDEDYRAWRGERRQAFGETFSEWRRNRTADAQDRIEPPPWQAEADPASTSPDMNAEAETRYELGGPSEAKGDSEAKGGVGFAQASPAVQKATDGAAKDDREAKDRG